MAALPFAVKRGTQDQLPVARMSLVQSHVAEIEFLWHSEFSSGDPAAANTRPVVILPGLGNNSNDYNELKMSLEDKGLPVTVAQVSRPDWLRNALGLLDGNYWSGKLTPRPVLDWYFERIKVAIAAAKEQRGDTKVSLVGHSAGGWLARVYMSEFGVGDIAMLLSLGTPHLPPPKGIPGVIDQTRGLLDYVNEVCPGNCFAPDVDYICVAGRFLKGERFFPAKMPVVATTGLGTLVATDKEQVSSVSESTSLENNSKDQKQSAITFQSRIVGQGYKQVCGQADVWGDGVVPQMSAHLDGAKNITLDGVYHSPVGARLPDRPWYGSAGILEQWVEHLL
ncbi:hypothetical protein GOP47_0017560 [Adiantum capillus-veneris]|uniref:GPI inositol-deacylase n=1 Tax=Adiantum capillus-veneris TaxID=13818 RepID=A0A9D4UG29_ADICA|nr:hypothetical protein GOP47_0017560 [Adiantum capillus-veneris]